jgi:hypothetical protein
VGYTATDPELHHTGQPPRVHVHVKEPPATLRRLLVTLLLCTCWNLAQTRSAHAGLPAPHYRLDELAVALRDAPAAQRADFARAALAQLATAYATEAVRARREARLRGGAPDLRRWAAAVDAHARKLAILGETVIDSTPVHVALNPDNSIVMVVDGTPVEINGPRSRDQVTLERAVMEHFCSQSPCADLISTSAPSEPEDFAGSATPHWSFSAGSGPVCRSQDGLEFRFQDSRDLRRKRDACARAVAELRSLASKIADYRASGRPVQWSHLAIRRLPGGDSHLVELDRGGGYVELYLPLLARTPQLLRLARPWLVARASDLDHELVVRDAESLFPAAGSLGR